MHVIQIFLRPLFVSFGTSVIRSHHSNLCGFFPQWKAAILRLLVFLRSLGCSCDELTPGCFDF